LIFAIFGCSAHFKNELAGNRLTVCEQELLLCFRASREH